MAHGVDLMGGYLISIIIATYNAGKNLEACLNSIAEQSVDGIEIVVVDGGSNDDTISILKKSNHSGLSWISEPDKGIYDALNKGIKRAGGRWLYFLGSDDKLLPGFSALASRMNSSNTVYYGMAEAYYLPGKRPDYELLTGKFSKYKLAKYCLNHQSIIYPAAVFAKYNYQPGYPVFADYLLNMQVWGDGDFIRKFFPISIVLYNMTGFSSGMKDVKFEQDKPALIKKNLGQFVYWRWLFKFYKKKFRGETF
jgi:glycosyltransferase involved in cell wall biosynthesis